MIGHGAKCRLKGDFERLPNTSKKVYKDLIFGVQSFFEPSPNREQINWLIQQKMSYSVTTKIQEGEAAERILDEYFRQRWHVIPVTHELQHRGIDRVLIQRNDFSMRLLVDYKADAKAAQTGNAFIELESRFSTGVQIGWAESSFADLIIYFLPSDRQAMIIPTIRLRAVLAEWRQTYQTKLTSSFRESTGERWQTLGLIVPLHVVRNIVAQVIRV